MSYNYKEIDIVETNWVPDSQCSNAAAEADVFFGILGTQDSMLATQLQPQEHQTNWTNLNSFEKFAEVCSSQEYQLSQATKAELLSSEQYFPFEDLNDEVNLTDNVLDRNSLQDVNKNNEVVATKECQNESLEKVKWEVEEPDVFHDALQFNFNCTMNDMNIDPFSDEELCTKMNLKVEHDSKFDVSFSMDEPSSSQILTEDNMAVSTSPEPKNNKPKDSLLEKKEKSVIPQEKKKKKPKATATRRKRKSFTKSSLKKLELLEDRPRLISESSTTTSKYEAASESSMLDYPSANISPIKDKPVKKTKKPLPVSDVYKIQRRKSNAEAAKRLREKKKKEAQQNQEKLAELENFNKELISKIENVKDEFQQLYTVFISSNLSDEIRSQISNSMMRFRDNF